MLAVGLVLALLAGITIGSVGIPVAAAWQDIVGRLTGRMAGVDALTDQIIWSIRLPRVLLAAVTGAALSMAGVCFQALVRNPLADPFVLGVASGASFGAVLVMVNGGGVVLSLKLGVTGAAFVTALATTLVVFLLAQRVGRLSDSRLILAGVAVAYLATAATSSVQLKAAPGQLQGVMFWLMGSLAGVDWSDLALAGPLILVTSLVLAMQGRRLNALAAGDEEAIGMGVNAHRLRIGLLIAASLLTAAVVSVVGGVGFVGLIIPHITRLLVGADHRRVLPISLLAGAVFMVLVDLGARTLAAPSELPLGILTAAVGAPFFLFLLRRRAAE